MYYLLGNIFSSFVLSFIMCVICIICALKFFIFNVHIDILLTLLLTIIIIVITIGLVVS